MADIHKARAELRRLAAESNREPGANWKRWGPFLSERQWGTVREDDGTTGEPWQAFTHDDAVWKAYRWGEDGILGITDRQCRLCFAIALWNGKDPILKERLFGLGGPEGNHGEDVKECYYYLDSTPTHSYLKGLYKYPQAPFPYEQLVSENHRRSRLDQEFELTDTGVFDDGRYFDVFVEYAKAEPEDILIRITVANRSEASAELDLLPTFWFRNTWSHSLGPGTGHQQTMSRTRAPVCGPRASRDAGPFLDSCGSTCRRANSSVDLHRERDQYVAGGQSKKLRAPPARDAFHLFLIKQQTRAINLQPSGTKSAACYKLSIPAGSEVEVRLRLTRVQDDTESAAPFGEEYSTTMEQRRMEADAFYDFEGRPGPLGRRKTGPPPGERRFAVDQTILFLLGRGVARRGSRTSPAADLFRDSQQRLAASRQSRRRIDA